MPQFGSPEPIKALNRIKLIEIPEEQELVDLRLVCPQIVYRPHVIPFARPKVAKMLKAAYDSLPSNIIGMFVKEAWRPLVRQQRLYDNYFHSLLEKYPDRRFTTQRRCCNRFFAPYDQKAPPGHCTGGAIDVGLLDSQGEILDVSSPLEGWKAATTHCVGLSSTAAANRKILVDAMLNAGFSNCRDEYWHYSYGDAAWAVRTGSSVCCYGLAQLPEEIWSPFEEIATRK